MTKTSYKKKLKASTTLNNLFIFTVLSLALSCARYISYQEKVIGSKEQFGAVWCEESYTQKSDVYLGEEGNTELFKIYKQKHKLNFFETVLSFSRFQQFLRPDIISPSSRVQIFFGYDKKIYYAEAVSANDELNSPLFFLLDKLKQKFNFKTVKTPSMADLLPHARVENELALFLKQNKDSLAKIANTDNVLRNFYFKGENVLAAKESYANHQLPTYLSQISIKPSNYQMIIQEIDLNNPNYKHLCTNLAAVDVKDYFTLREEISLKVRHHQFGLSMANGDFFLALFSQSNLQKNFPKTPLLLSANSPSVPWCIRTEKNEKDGQLSFTLVTSIGQKNPHQLLQSFLWNNLKDPLPHFLDRLSDERFIFIGPPLRVISEYLSEDETLTQFQKIPFEHLGVSIQQIPIYHQDQVGEIIGITKGPHFQSFYFDGRNDDKYMTCPKNQL